MPTITQLQYLIAVDREKHFGQAAKSCHVAQPSLSMQIQKLEEELGAIVFDRSKKPIITTDVGRAIIKQVHIILREHRKLSAIANLGSKTPTGEFNLAVIPTLAPYLIPLFIGVFAKKYPQVILRIFEHKTEDIIRLLANDQIDAGLLVTPLGDDRLIERHLFFEPFYAYVSKAHRLSNNNKISEKDLDYDNLWLLEEGHCFRGQVLKLCSTKKRSVALENVEFASGNLETVKNLVKLNSGYTLLPELALMDLSSSEKKKYIKEFKKPVPTREVSLVHSRSFLKETIIGAMEKEIIESLPQQVNSLKRKDLTVVDID